MPPHWRKTPSDDEKHDDKITLRFWIATSVYMFMLILIGNNLYHSESDISPTTADNDILEYANYYVPQQGVFKPPHVREKESMIHDLLLERMKWRMMQKKTFKAPDMYTRVNRFFDECVGKKISDVLRNLIADFHGLNFNLESGEIPDQVDHGMVFRILLTDPQPLRTRDDQDLMNYIVYRLSLLVNSGASDQAEGQGAAKSSKKRPRGSGGGTE